MSKPDAASGSLESILASIRKSLAEQATDAPSEAVASPPAPTKEASARKGGLRQRLAGAGAGAPPASADAQAGDDLADMLEEQISNPAAVPSPEALPAAISPPPEAKPAAAAAPASRDAKLPEEDPLWFLTRRDELAAAEPAAGAEAPAPAKAPAEPILTPPEVVRATMPPFFGSTAEVVKPEPAPAPAARQAWAPEPPSAPPIASPVPAAPQPPLPAAPVEGNAAKPQPASGASQLNGRGRAAAEAPAEAIGLGGANPGAALESAVLELLKPMLRQWLDQNMPRLVAEALKNEAARVRPSDTGTKA